MGFEKAGHAYHIAGVSLMQLNVIILSVTLVEDLPLMTDQCSLILPAHAFYLP